MLAEIIPKFPRYQQTYLIHAAERWRLPYWDWASTPSKKPIYDSSPAVSDYDVPRLIRLEYIQIKSPEGSKWVKNPLYVFKMPKNAVMGEGGVHALGELHVRPIHPWRFLIANLVAVREM